jgi:predicted acylesterase/phospholipase RssA
MPARAMTSVSLIRRVAPLFGGVLLAACGALPRLAAVPPDLTEKAAIPGIANARFWFDQDLAPFIAEVMADEEREKAALKREGKPTDPMPPVHFLAISGGGDNGAFGAGLLSGWTASGTRPQFKVVTGISAGALIAPFAFLGPDYDDVIRTVATTLRAEDVFNERSTISGLASDGMADSAPLARLVAKYVTPEVLAAVAREYGKGRFLQIGTTDLDAGRAVQWNMGAIAASNAPGALDLFRKIMIASTSIPGAVSPVMIDVEAGGRRFQEMHADGGVIAQIVTYPARMMTELRLANGGPIRRTVHLYVIRNGQPEPEWASTPRSTLDIGGRAIGMLVQTQGINDLERIYRAAAQDGIDFNVAYIDADFAAPHPQEFDPRYMHSLFDYAYQLSAKRGYPWHKTPPNDLERAIRRLDYP